MSDPPLREGEDYYRDALGRVVFTAAYHLRRGSCCGNGCRHCPFDSPDARNPNRPADKVRTTE
ncbi:MAG: hypothetical protein GC159_04055 [Phycisphaera sp.]|nr:hypothetical protein [Phycisphaera sp.]